MYMLWGKNQNQTNKKQNEMVLLMWNIPSVQKHQCMIVSERGSFSLETLASRQKPKTYVPVLWLLSYPAESDNRRTNYS